MKNQELAVKSLSREVVECSLGGDPTTAFTLTRIDSDNTVYAPTESNPQSIEGKKGILLIRELVSLLPKVNLWNGEETDYPSKINLSECGASLAPVSARQIWVIGGTLFFRRYNDEWNACVMYAKTFEQGLSWKVLGAKKLQLLLELVKSKDPATISQEELFKSVGL